MNEDARQYTNRIEHRNILGPEAESLSYDSPEWIINLKNYFEKDTTRDNHSSHS